jgi:translation initiation factor eIF-2B subunit delta
MTTEATATPVAGAAAPGKGQKKDKLEQNATAPPGEKKLTGAELKAKAKAEKQARRAQAKTTPGPPAAAGGNQSGAQGGGGDGKGGKSKPKQDGPQTSGGGSTGRQPAKAAATIASAAVVKETKPAIPECFSHISVAKRIQITSADKDVHPAVLVVGQQMSAFAIKDSIARLEATMLSFKKVCLLLPFKDMINLVANLWNLGHQIIHYPPRQDICPALHI